MNKEKKLYLVIIVIVIVIIAGIWFFKSRQNDNIDENTIKCIASKTILYSSSICSHCTDQKNILGTYYSLFNAVDCFQDSEKQKCIDAGIEATPTWVFQGQKYEGVKSIGDLKKLTGC